MYIMQTGYYRDNPECGPKKTIALLNDDNQIKIIIIKTSIIEIQHHMWNVKENNRCDWSHVKITRTVPEQQTKTARN